uniref:Uncharacterized protein n=1 Tax=Spongospora subterranea TaxID=70186 RepID=A0A0H5R9K9_9EUKA|eukprot:CRZ10481.1 hypothetical protein [Spongospora subterranea]
MMGLVQYQNDSDENSDDERQPPDPTAIAKPQARIVPKPLPSASAILGNSASATLFPKPPSARKIHILSDRERPISSSQMAKYQRTGDDNLLMVPPQMHMKRPNVVTEESSLQQAPHRRRSQPPTNI